MADEIAPPENAERFVTVEEAADFLGYKPQTVRNMVSEGDRDLPFHRLPTGALRFRISELAAWAAGHPKAEVA